MTFYVFQGGTFSIEYRGGYIWAPLYSQGGNKVFHWENMTKVKTGDIILHGCNAQVVAASIATSDCYECNRPKERAFEISWDEAGRRVDLRYTRFQNPIKTSDYVKEILQYCRTKYSPFDKDGNGNLGYLYELDENLAKVFLRAAEKSNPDLYDIDYIQHLLADSTAQE